VSDVARSARMLVVDDDPAIRKILADRFRALGHDVATATDGDSALAWLDTNDADVVLLDLQMPKTDGFAVLAALARRGDMPATIVVTAHGSIEAAVRAVKAGATDFVTKPFDAAHLEHTVDGVLDRLGLRRRVKSLELELSSRHSLVLGASRAMADAHETAMRAAASDATILLRGESGTGKEVIARAVHAASKRKSGPFVAINCAALGADLLESELFGHEKGSFTGAVAAKPGLLEAAAGGSVLLDEIGELQLDLQAKLLRAIETREVTRVGAVRAQPIDIRFMAATHRDLASSKSSGGFRRDLFYRLAGITLAVPPLRERRERITSIANELVRASGRKDDALTESARSALLAHHWPGNVRELRNVIDRAILIAGNDPIAADHIMFDTSQPSAPSTGEADLDPDARAERDRIVAALDECAGNQTHAAKKLGISRATLVTKLAVYRVPRPRKR
jgi:DNA-binding NtrC family response regulator